ncbi:MAG: hypothetical protein D6830_02950, partial [Ignavibacteria bacterium]
MDMKKTIALIFIIIFNLSAQDLQMYGEAKPGSIVILGGDIKFALLNGDTLQTDDKGFTLFGFDRDDKGTYLLKVKLNSGKVIFRKIELPKRKYKIQRINNMKKKYVTPPPEEIKRIAKEREIKKRKKAEIGKIDSAL